ncbi:hypothetical protein RN001_002557 [Aquatica leii]|uniref:Uncharacterized protein n=1 Tax=Aquatica leii TaxID=1421715 RepID=A0AAN7PMJ0_9COLE|nr:hypothetical protein RN001_002557 [Aquatica leii]
MQILLVLLLIVINTSAKQEEGFVAVTQDTDGNYDFKYAVPGITRAENRDFLGNVVGAFSYVDTNGILRETQYTAGVDGYHAFGPDIPVPVEDTPDVAQAKLEHLSKLYAAYGI